MRKIISILLSFIMLLSITAGLDFSVYAQTDNDYEFWMIDDGIVEILKYNGNETDITIPSKLDGCRVTSIFPSAFSYCENLTSVTIPDSITDIGSEAFKFCTNLKSVTIGSNVTSIAYRTFYNCRSLKNVIIPNSVKSIGYLAFYNCTDLSSVTIGNGVTSIDDEAFRFCMSLKSITIGDSVTSIGEYAFDTCTSLTNVTISKSVTDINDFLFQYCDSLESVTLGNSVTSIGDYAFLGCTNLTSVIIPNSVISMGTWVFYDCTKLTDVYYSGTIDDWHNISIGSNNETLENVTIHCKDGVINCHHTYKTVTTKATTNKNGSIVAKCTKCDEVTKSTIYYPKTITLSKTSYVYNGKAQKPSVTVKDSKGNKIPSNNYTVSYSSGRKNVGKYTVTIKFKGNYSGTVKKTFTIIPKTTTVSKLTAGKKAFTVKWKKQATQTTGYQIQYSRSSNFKSAKNVTVSKNKTTSKKISKLSAKKKYYIRVRTYKTVNGKKIYSDWSKVKTVTTKK